MKQPQLIPWVPREQLLTEFDIKLGKLAASVKNRPCTEAEIKHACNTADKIILSIMRQDQNGNRKRLCRTQNKNRKDEYP